LLREILRRIAGKHQILLAAVQRPHYTQLQRPSELYFVGAQGRIFMNRRISILVVALLLAGIFSVRGANSSAPAVPARKAINLPTDNPQLPFSGAIQTGNTLYLSGRIGLDPKTGKAPAEIDDEIHAVLENIKATLTQAGMNMDDLVYVQIACTDLSFYDKFNAAYRSYFVEKDLPAREFIGVSTLLRGGHFEIQAIAVKR
jgi:2-iminobutanoate/2-iminopropanoate deaminase